MAIVSIKFNGKDFLLSCDDGQEEHLENLLIQINQKFNSLKSDLGNLGENKLLLITAIKVLDEYYETKKKIEQKKKELSDLSKKFKELKSLVYEYKDNKEDEIKSLNNNLDELKRTIDENQKKYEQVLDAATSEISSFIENMDNKNISNQYKVNKLGIRKKILNQRKKKYFQNFDNSKIYNFLKKYKKNKIGG